MLTVDLKREGTKERKTISGIQIERKNWILKCRVQRCLAFQYSVCFSPYQFRSRKTIDLYFALSEWHLAFANSFCLSHSFARLVRLRFVFLLFAISLSLSLRPGDNVYFRQFFSNIVICIIKSHITIATAIRAKIVCMLNSQPQCTLANQNKWALLFCM